MGQSDRSKTSGQVTEESAMHIALRLLTRRRHTEWELIQKLRKRRIPREIIDGVVSRCREYRYVDDPSTAEFYIDELKAKGYGIYFVRDAMRKKGFDPDLMESSLQERYPASDEPEAARHAISRKTLSLQREGDRKKRNAKLYRYLYGRGFSPSTIHDLLESRD